MALLWFDGFESYNSLASINRLSNLIAGGFDISTSYGRRDSIGIRIDPYGESYMFEVEGEPSTVIFGYALKLSTTAAPYYQANYTFTRILDALNTGNVHLKFYVNSSRLIEVRNNANGLLATSSGHTLEGLTWYFIEIKATIHDSTGSVIIKIDGDEVLNVIGVNTLNGSNAYVGGIYLSGARDVHTYFDDLYCLDTTGAKNNDFLGDIRVDPIRPNGAGTYSQFTPSAGNNYENVDEDFPDDDTTYNDGSNVADKDSYAMESVPDPVSTTIHGVKSQITARKTDAGTRKCKILTRAGTTDDLGDEITLSDSFVTYTSLLEDNPDDSLAWEDADVNSVEMGMEITV